MRKKLLIVLGALLGLLLLAAVLVPLLLKDRVLEAATAAAEDQLEVDLSVGSASLGLLRSFPNLGLRLDDVTILGRGEFADVPLARVGRLEAEVALDSVLSPPIRIRRVELASTALRLERREDGKANWQITKPKEAAPDAEPAETPDLALESLVIRDLDLLLDDRQAGLRVELKDLDHESTGNLDAARFLWETQTGIASVDVVQKGTAWLRKAPLDLRADLDVNRETGLLTLKDNRLRLGSLALDLAGTILAKKGTQLDLTLDAKTPDLKALISLVPGLAEGALDGMTTGGTVTLAGFVKGVVGSGRIPGFGLDLAVRDGSYAYAKVAEKVDGIQLEAKLLNGGSAVDDIVVELPRFEARVAGNTLRGRAQVKRPLSELDLKVGAKGKVDLATLARLLPTGGEAAAGVLDLDVDFSGKVRKLTPAGYQDASAKGTVDVADLRWPLEGAKLPLEVPAAKLVLTPRTVRLDRFVARFGDSDLSGTGQLDNLPGFLLLDETLVGRLETHSERVDLDQAVAALPRSEKSDDKTPPAERGPRPIARVPDRLDVRVDSRIDRLTYNGLDMNSVRGVVQIKDRALDIEKLDVRMLGGGLSLGGLYDSKPERPRMDLGLDVVRIDLTDAVEALPFLSALAPLAASGEGRLSTDLRLGGDFGEGMKLALDTLVGGGGLIAHGLRLEGSDTLDAIATALSNDKLKRLDIGGVKLDFSVKDGLVRVRPFDFSVGPIQARFGGGHKMNAELDYTLTLDLPAEGLSGPANAALTDLFAKSPLGGGGGVLPDRVAVDVGIGGTVKKPQIRVNLAGTGQKLGEAVLDKAMDIAEEQADRALGAAKAEAEKQLAVVRAQAEAARTAARKAADQAKKAAYRGADRLVSQAGSPVAKLGAQAAADQAKKEADRAYRDALKKADADFEAAIADAKKKVEDLETEARDDAKDAVRKRRPPRSK